jgi:2-keto-4-pentenoate hydratase/2-oxohepta-3-ene-1,7-dioic acid hydratase in catechol pathway
MLEQPRSTGSNEELADPLALQLALWVNDEKRPRSSTDDRIYGLYAQIEYLARVMTLEPGDVVRIDIKGLGHIENRRVAEAT